MRDVPAPVRSGCAAVLEMQLPAKQALTQREPRQMGEMQSLPRFFERDMAKTIISLDAFISAAILPSGYRFKEWTPGNLVAAVPAKSDDSAHTYYDTVMAAIEGPDGKYAAFEIFNLKESSPGMERGLVYLSAAELAQAVDQAIGKLAA